MQPRQAPIETELGRGGVRGFVNTFAIAIGIAAAAQAGQVCDLAFKDCPARFDKSVITVPVEAIALEARAPLCSEGVQVGSGTASIVFIIDHSASMDDIDLTGARFGVVSALLDEIKAAAPAAEIGLVVFSDILHFDDRDNGLFQSAFPGDAVYGHDAFVPLLALNRVFPGGRTGLDTLKTLLRYHAVPGAGLKLYAETARRTGGLTDITLGFDAGKEAMKTAASPRASQYFIFISDGLPGGVHPDRAARENEFIQGKEAPATFTVYFDAGGTVPDAIAQMTANIRANGYSASNPKSSNVTVNQPGSQLLATLRTQVLNQVFLGTVPKSVSVSSAGKTRAGSGKDATGFLLPGRMALRADTTALRFEYTAAYTYSDPSKGAVGKDTVFGYGLTVRRAASGAALPDGLELACREQASLEMYAAGARLSEVTSEQGVLEIRLTPSAGEKCQGCPVEARPSQGIDRESVSLSPNGGNARGTLRRAMGEPAAGDGVLQHGEGDSLVVIYVNEELPLEVVRAAWPFRKVAPVTLDLRPWNQVAKPRPDAAADADGWTVMATGLDLPADRREGRCCIYRAPFGSSLVPADSLQYVGVRVEASGEFKLEARVFTNLGQFVGKTVIALTRAEFDRLPKGSRDSSRVFDLLWDNRDADGHPVGSGAYIFATRVTLSRTGAVNAYNRIVGVLRGQ